MAVEERAKYVEELYRKGMTPAEIVRYGCAWTAESRDEVLTRVIRFFDRQDLPLDREALERKTLELEGPASPDPSPAVSGNPSIRDEPDSIGTRPGGSALRVLLLLVVLSLLAVLLIR